MLQRILLFMALMSAVTPKGLSQYGEVISTVKDIFVAVIYDNVVENGLSNRWSAWPNGMPALKGKLLDLGQNLTVVGTDLACSHINKWFPSFWSRCSRFSLGVVSPDLVRNFMYKLLPIMAFSKNKFSMVADFSDQQTFMRIANSDPNDYSVIDEVKNCPKQIKPKYS